MHFPEHVLKWLLLTLVLLLFVLLPFSVFGEALESWAVDQMKSDRAPTALVLIGTGLLAFDVVLPVPSSVVGTMLGALVGISAGMLSAAAGMTVGCGVGYALGRIAGPTVAVRLVGPGDYLLVARWLDRHGVVALAACRAVPVLAEVSVILAGVAGMSVMRVLAVTALANLGIGAVYASIGALAMDVSGLFLAFAASLLVPALVLLPAAALSRSTRRLASKARPG